MKRESFFLGALLVLLPLLGALPATATEPFLGEPAPVFELPSLDGDRVSLTDFRGKLVVLHFGAGW